MAVAFSNPPPPGAEGDDTSDPIYQSGTPVGVKWSGVAASLTLWQLQPGSVKTFNTSEFLIDNTNTENSSDIHTYTDFNWLVKTSQNLTLSNRFILNLFNDTNQSTLLASSHYFQIRGDSNSNASFTSSAVPTYSSTGTPIGIVTATITTTPLITTNPPVLDIRPLGLSVGAKAGLGVGVPAAVLLGVLVGWFCVRRGKGRKSVKDERGDERDEEVGSEKEEEEGTREELPGCHGGKELIGSLPPQYELGV